jgi:hypothetical protein
LSLTQPWITTELDPLASAIPAVARPAVSPSAAAPVSSRRTVALPPTAPLEERIPREENNRTFACPLMQHRSPVCLH